MNKNLYFLFGSLISFLISILLGILTGIDIVKNSIIISFFIHWFLFIPAYIFKTEKFFDLAGSFTYISIVLYVLISSNEYKEPNIGSIILSFFIIIWAIRLGTFLYIRIKKAGEDKRVREIKKSFNWFFMTWTFSGMWVSICSLCAITGISNGIKFTETTYIGIIIFIIGFLIEIIADSQKTSFRKKIENRDKFITKGLWRYSRHPNYLGEIILWIGISLMSYSALEGSQIFTLISPVFTYVLLVYISGINFLEQSGEKKWGNQKEYKDYKSRTPRLIWFL